MGIHGTGTISGGAIPYTNIITLGICYSFLYAAISNIIRSSNLLLFLLHKA